MNKTKTEPKKTRNEWEEVDVRRTYTVTATLPLQQWWCRFVRLILIFYISSFAEFCLKCSLWLPWLCLCAMWINKKFWSFFIVGSLNYAYDRRPYGYDTRWMNAEQAHCQNPNRVRCTTEKTKNLLNFKWSYMFSIFFNFHALSTVHSRFAPSCRYCHTLSPACRPGIHMHAVADTWRTKTVIFHQFAISRSTVGAVEHCNFWSPQYFITRIYIVPFHFSFREETKTKPIRCGCVCVHLSSQSTAHT